MKLTMIQSVSGPVPAAVLRNGQVIDLAAVGAAGLMGGHTASSVAEILNLDTPLQNAVRRAVENAEEGRQLDHLHSLNALRSEPEVTYAPILQPRLILSCGMAYKEHMEEMGVALPKAPTAFLKSVNALNAHRQPILLPAQDPAMVDFECEFSCVIGRGFHDVAPEDALRHVAGFTMANDVGSRSLVPQWLQSMKESDPMECVRLYALTVLGKQFPSFCPLGPVVVTADEFGDPNDVAVETRLNGEVMQSAHASDLIFSLAYSLSYFSRWYRFEPGDVLTTGSPSGVGFARTPPRFLRAGDLIEVSASRIGKLSNPVIAA